MFPFQILFLTTRVYVRNKNIDMVGNYILYIFYTKGGMFIEENTNIFEARLDAFWVNFLIQLALFMHCYDNEIDVSFGIFYFVISTFYSLLCCQLGCVEYIFPSEFVPDRYKICFRPLVFPLLNEL